MKIVYLSMYLALFYLFLSECYSYPCIDIYKDISYTYFVRLVPRCFVVLNANVNGTVFLI
jgi:hypothetical protein